MGFEFGAVLENAPVLRDWRSVLDTFSQFQTFTVGRDEFGDLSWNGWIFRGHKKSTYPLKPSIEREPVGVLGWAALERAMMYEFQAKAPLYVKPSSLPSQDDPLSWLAI